MTINLDLILKTNELVNNASLIYLFYLQYKGFRKVTWIRIVCLFHIFPMTIFPEYIHVGNRLYEIMLPLRIWTTCILTYFPIDNPQNIQF